jgi:hypothetical protein
MGQGGSPVIMWELAAPTKISTLNSMEKQEQTE